MSVEQPHEICFDQLSKMQHTQMKAHGTDAALAAAMAIGELAAAVVPDERREAVAELANELIQRWAGAMAIVEVKPKGEA